MRILRITGVFFLYCSGLLCLSQPNVEIRVNLAGYPPNMPKKALVLSKEALKRPVLLMKNEQGEVISKFKALPEEHAWEPFSHYYSVDFSEFQEAGTYSFELKREKIQSNSFPIGHYPNWQEDVVRFIQTQRCGFNPYTREFCHQLDGLSFFGIRPDSTRIDATGGWHDAGDQLKYLITGSNTTARLLMGYQNGSQ